MNTPALQPLWVCQFNLLSDYFNQFEFYKSAVDKPSGALELIVEEG
ncbi:hypothetical protein CLV24_13152 [Pontibacter ummariensis]|uniref:Uncharacterized protein n=1 Tax=Pontibacter ummariensis TaxID=1610492 RepID=A0A239KTZ2_9BACT|nr:hypothetical protein CLV24_13152 [Pontibacter ummariensis]SNT21490.1 hypothetical protein SAMN06296052_13152 [Pontibacter ummariensis]